MIDETLQYLCNEWGFYAEIQNKSVYSSIHINHSNVFPFHSSHHSTFVLLPLKYVDQKCGACSLKFTLQILLLDDSLLFNIYSICWCLRKFYIKKLLMKPKKFQGNENDSLEYLWTQ